MGSAACPAPFGGRHHSLVKAWCIGIGEVTVFGVAIRFSKLTLVAEFIVMALVLVWRPNGPVRQTVWRTPEAMLADAAGAGATAKQHDRLCLGLLGMVLLPGLVGEYTRWCWRLT